MHSGGYLDRNVKSASPARLGIVVALHGAAIAALMLAPPEVVPRIDWKPLNLIQIDDEPPPPPIKAPPPTQKANPDNIDQPTSVINIPKTDSNETVFTRNPPDDAHRPTPVLPPFVEPVHVEASFVNGTEIQPDYPPSLARQEIEGVVTVRVLIGTDGRVKAVEQVSATEPEFFEATKRQALRHWRFKPATSDGVAIESWRQMTVRFKLEA